MNEEEFFREKMRQAAMIEEEQEDLKLLKDRFSQILEEIKQIYFSVDEQLYSIYTSIEGTTPQLEQKYNETVDFNAQIESDHRFLFDQLQDEYQNHYKQLNDKSDEIMNRRYQGGNF